MPRHVIVTSSTFIRMGIIVINIFGMDFITSAVTSRYNNGCYLFNFSPCSYQFALDLKAVSDW